MAKKSVNNNHKGSEDYSAEDITVMEGLEAVRKDLECILEQQA